MSLSLRGHGHEHTQVPSSHLQSSHCSRIYGFFYNNPPYHTPPPPFSFFLYFSGGFAESQSFSGNSRSATYFNINAGELVLAKSLPYRAEIILCVLVWFGFFLILQKRRNGRMLHKQLLYSLPTLPYFYID